MNGKLALLPAVAVGSVGLFFGVGLILEAVSSTEEANVAAPAKTPTEQIEIVPPTPEEQPFVGEMLGIQFGPEDVLRQKGVIREEPTCPTTSLALVNLPGEGPSVPPRPNYLPDGAIMPPTKPAAPFDVPNPATNWCPDTGYVYSAWRYYELPKLATGYTPHIFIAREPQRAYTTAPYRPSELEIVEVGGRQLVRIGTAQEIEGRPSDMQLLIPEGSGMITFRTSGVRFEEAIAVAESFISAFEASS